MAYRIANEVDAAALDAAASSPSAVQIQPPASAAAAQAGPGAGQVAQSSNGTAARPAVGMAPPGGPRRMDEDEEREAVRERLEVLGYRVGQGLVERYVVPPNAQTARVLQFSTEPLLTCACPPLV